MLELKKFELVLYNFIKENSKLPTHSFKEKSKYSYHLKKLLYKGLIIKKGYGVWEVVKEVQTSSKTSSNFSLTTMETSEQVSKQVQKVRSHAYRFLIKLPFIQNWERRTEFLEKHNIKYTKTINGQIVKIRKHNIILHNETLQVVFKKGKYFVGTDPILNNGQAIVELEKTLVSLERLLMTNIKFDKNYMLQCHHANINNALAKYYRERGVNKWSIKDSKGEEWLLVDNSFNLLELETIHPKTATKDYKIVVEPLMNTLKENPNIISDLKKDNTELKENLKQLSELCLKQQQENLKLTDELRTLTLIVTTLVEKKSI